jgi:hypothetical protein
MLYIYIYIYICIYIYVHFAAQCFYIGMQDIDIYNVCMYVYININPYKYVYYFQPNICICWNAIESLMEGAHTMVNG